MRVNVGRGGAAVVSSVEREFVLQAVREECRADGRKPFEYRDWGVDWGR